MGGGAGQIGDADLTTATRTRRRGNGAVPAGPEKVGAASRLPVPGPAALAGIVTDPASGHDPVRRFGAAGAPIGHA
ncbi:hypothetical protein JCM9534A_65730 [Catenuloplanes indicus JCM 9534]